jgi:hypothetical protein
MPKNEGQSYTGLIRERFDHLVERMNFGDSQNTLVNQLNKEGFSLSVKTFRELLHRVKKERSAAAAATVSQVKLTKAARHDEIRHPKQPSPLLNLNQHGGFTMPPPLTPEEIF